MERGRSKARLMVAPAERERLEAWTRRPKTAQALAVRSRIVLQCAAGTDNTDAAVALGITRQMVGKWRQRFLDHPLEGLLDEPREIRLETLPGCALV